MGKSCSARVRYNHAYRIQDLELIIIVPKHFDTLWRHIRRVEPWFVFWRDAVGPKCKLWRDQTSLIRSPKCNKIVRLGIYRAQISLNFRYRSRFLSRVNMPVLSYHSRYVSIILTILIVCEFKTYPFCVNLPVMFPSVPSRVN